MILTPSLKQLRYTIFKLILFHVLKSFSFLVTNKTKLEFKILVKSSLTLNADLFIPLNTLTYI